MRGMGKQTHKRLAKAVASRGLERVCFTIEHLSRVVDRRLISAIDEVEKALRADTAAARSEWLARARASYSAAHVVASLGDERCYAADEWMPFTTWVAELVQSDGHGRAA